MPRELEPLTETESSSSVVLEEEGLWLDASENEGVVVELYEEQRMLLAEDVRPENRDHHEVFTVLDSMAGFRQSVRHVASVLWRQWTLAIRSTNQTLDVQLEKSATSVIVGRSWVILLASAR